jgi:putative endonuclease
MRDDSCLAFVEVRYRGEKSRVESALTVDRHKQRRIISAAAWFLSKNPEYADCVCRFDVVGVDRTRLGTMRVRWLRDAFRVE